MTDSLHPATHAAHGGEAPRAPFYDVAPPLHLSTTFTRDAEGGYPGGRVYSRDQSPAYDGPERLLAELEGGEQALLFSSGMAAASAVLHALTPGQRVLAPRALYWALRNWLREFCADWGLTLDWYANDDLDELARLIQAAPTHD